MKLLDYIGIIFQEKEHPYSPAVDKLLAKVMRDGHLTGAGQDWVDVRVGSGNYSFWAGDKWWGDLAEATCNGKYIYENKRPSRLMQLKFWRWVEKNGICRSIDSEVFA